MKRQRNIFALLPLLFTLCGCTSGGKGGATTLYGIAALISLLLLIAYLLVIKKRERWFTLLFSSIAVVNLGYFLLSLSRNLPEALMANRLAYLGSVFLPLTMLMNIIKVCRLPYKKWLPLSLAGLALIVFLIAASPGILPIYYKEVALGSFQGATILIKEYGPLHILYLFYLLGHFGVMIGIIFYSSSKKKIQSNAHALILLSAVFINILVWLLGQFIEFGFEPLSISYIISVLFLFGLHLMLQEAELNSPEAVDARLKDAFTAKLQTLTKTERKILDLYVAGKKSAEILKLLRIKENTLKYHNKNIYSKMEINKRKDLIEQGRKFL